MSENTISVNIENTKDLQPSYATLFRISEEPDAVTILLSHSVAGQTISSNVLTMTPRTARMNKDTVIPYYERAASLFPELKPALESSFGLQNPIVFYGTFLDFAHYGDQGQIRMCWVDIRMLAAIQKGDVKPSVPAGRTVAMFDMPLAVQLGVIKKLYMSL